MKYYHIAAYTLILVGCIQQDGCHESDSKENNDVERQQTVYVKTQPVPFFDWSLERHLMVELYKARNQAIHTYSYSISQMTGQIIAYCPSLGFPIPATTQLTNPNKWVAQGITLPQAEPNGLYSPPMTHATWVMCLSPDGKVEPAYWETDVLTFTRPMEEVNGKLVPGVGSSSISIDPRQPGK